MDEDSWHGIPRWGVIGGVIATILVVAGLLVTGGRTATILSKVGSAVGDSTGISGSGVDTSGQDPASGSGSGGTAGSGNGSSGGSEVADAAVFLLSNAGRGVSGEILMVDSGFHIMGGA